MNSQRILREVLNMKFPVYLVIFAAVFPIHSETKNGVFDDLVQFLDELLDWKDPKNVSYNFREKFMAQDLKKAQHVEVKSK